MQVVCSADPAVLERRYRDRAAERHPGHLDGDAETLAAILDDVRAGRYGPLPLDGPVLEVDSTALDDRAICDVISAVRRAIAL